MGVESHQGDREVVVVAPGAEDTGFSMLFYFCTFSIFHNKNV